MAKLNPPGSTSASHSTKSSHRAIKNKSSSSSKSTATTATTTTTTTTPAVKPTTPSSSSTSVSKTPTTTTTHPTIPQTTLKATFTSHYMPLLTSEFATDLDALRNADDFRDSALPMLVHALQQGTALFSEEEMKRVVVGGGDGGRIE